jgi:hypothetical protein
VIEMISPGLILTAPYSAWKAESGAPAAGDGDVIAGPAN